MEMKERPQITFEENGSLRNRDNSYSLYVFMDYRGQTENVGIYSAVRHSRFSVQIAEDIYKRLERRREAEVGIARQNLQGEILQPSGLVEELVAELKRHGVKARLEDRRGSRRNRNGN